MTTTQLTLTISGAVLAWLTIVFSIFAAGWLNQRSLERQIDEFKSAIRAEIATVNARLDDLNERVARIERQLDRIFQPILPKE